MTLARSRIVLRAHAKINLSLAVLGRRPDGYHDLRTVFQALELHDRVVCRSRPGPMVIRCSEPGVPSDARNLAWRAAAAAWAAAGRAGVPRQTEIVLEKRIPLEAGLGGGSSDAAATLVGVSRLWRLDFEVDRLRAIAAGIGADVPYFLCGGTALGVGRGDEIYPLADLPSAWVVLLLPSFGVATADAFAWHDRLARRRPRRGASPARLSKPAVIRWSDSGVALAVQNDLQAAVAAHHPEIDEMAAWLRTEGAEAASMSGSGSCVFGLFGSRQVARRAAARAGPAGWRAWQTRTVSRAESVRSI